jgi:competence/damage-inducible protein CinA-like protein
VPGSVPLNAAIVSVGNELLYGQTVDTNAAWLGRSLAAWGVPVVRRFTVGDVEEDIQDAVSSAIGVAGLVFVTGGLGPTPDDVTKQAVAALLGRAMTVDDGVRADLEVRFRTEGLEEIPVLSRGQAEVPDGARVLRNPCGTAPGLVIDEGGVRIVLLPGVPRELIEILTGDVESVLAEVVQGGNARLHHRVVHTTGIPETRLAELVESRLDELPEETTRGISLAYLPDLCGVDLRFTTAAGASTDARVRLDRLLTAMDEVLRPWSFEAESGELAEAVSRELRRSGRTLAVAESCTGGLFAKRMTDLAGSSDVFVGGVVAYANEVKVEQVGVSAEELARDGAVSEVVARQMALGVAGRFGAGAGVGITGIAGPGGGSDVKPVGTIWIAVALEGDVEAERCRFSGGREAIRERAAQAALAALYRRLIV